MATRSHRDDLFPSHTRPRRSTSLRSVTAPTDLSANIARTTGGLSRHQSQQETPNRKPSTAEGQVVAEHVGHGRSKSREDAGRGGIPSVLRSSIPKERDSNELELDDLLPLSDENTDDEEAGLTKREGRKRRKRRRTNALMDGVARNGSDGGGSSDSAKERIADVNVLRRLLLNALFIGLWYTFSLSISLYNEWMFSPKHLDFKFPLFTTCFHMLVQFSLASLVLYCFPRFRPRSDGLSNPRGLAHDPARDGLMDSTRPLMTMRFYLSRIGPCGAATGLDIGLGNMSMKFITLTFFTMCKSSSLAFVLLFAFLFRLETPSVRLVLIIFTMTMGVVMMVAGETAFDAVGFILIISSAFFSGFRWALTQILLLRNPATSNPFSTIHYLAPIMCLSLIALALPVEGATALRAGLVALAAKHGAVRGTLLLLFPGVLAFCMTTAEFALLQRTSVVTLSICGIFKEVVTISAAGIIFHDRLTPINLSGLAVTVASIAAYNYIKVTKMRADAREKLTTAGMEPDDEEAESEVVAMMADHEARMSTSELVREAVRSSLTLVGPGAKDRVGEQRDRQSPIKRPGDLESE